MLMRIILFLAREVKNRVFFIFIQCLSDKHMRKLPKQHLALFLNIHRWKEKNQIVQYFAPGGNEAVRSDVNY